MPTEKQQYLFIGGCADGRRIYVDGRPSIALPPDLFRKRDILEDFDPSPECEPLQLYKLRQVIAVGAAYVIKGMDEQLALNRIRELSE